MTTMVTSLQLNVTAYIVRSYNNATASPLHPCKLMLQHTLCPYNLMSQPIYYALTIQRYSLSITSLQSNATASPLRPYNPMLQHIYFVLII